VRRERGEERLERFHDERQVRRGGRARWGERREDELFFLFLKNVCERERERGRGGDTLPAARSWILLNSGASRGAKTL
jgi:hypothetical protein